ncbi:MAG: transpeptidase family protein [Spirochaetales bacterium]|nr:transpeptidase family protein [Leptospiraceae bacterium]MCP5483640.1 transpeptidase family protein [Spirochaetales bacterium]MCP5484495.1 transpeptidase family protein [Spirochaetales bacterium]
MREGADASGLRKSRARLTVVAIVFTVAFCVVAFRIAYFALTGPASSGQDDPVLRGPIQDRRGFTLAVTEEASSIAVDPGAIYDVEQTAQLLGNRLDMDPARIVERIYQHQDRRWLYIKRQVDNLTADQILDLNLPGVYREREHRRNYPAHSLASNLLGFVGRDQTEALEGVERYYNELLLQSDPDAPSQGPTLQLTLDAFMQYRLEREMDAAFEASGSKRAAGMIMNISTGEILAMVSLPNYDPNEYYRSTAFQRGNWNIRLNYEPGSTVKVFMAAILLSENLVRPNELFHCDGEIHFRDSVVRCRNHGRVVAHGDLNLSQIIERSCNVGIIKAMQRVPRERLYHYMSALGFGSETLILPPGSGEEPGYFPDLNRWVPSTSYYMPIGQGFSVTPIQLLRAGASIASGGILVRPRVAERVLTGSGRVLNETQPIRTESPISPEVNRRVLDMMRGVVLRGTGRGANIPGMAIAGKTGTGEKSSARGYLNRYVVSFMGFFPADSPRYGALILFDEPQGDDSGGSLAAPVFGRVVAGILPYIEERTEAVEPGPLPPLPVRPPRVDRTHLYDFRGMSARDAMELIADYYGVPFDLEGSGYVYAQSPQPGTSVEQLERIVLYLDELR